MIRQKVLLAETEIEDAVKGLVRTTVSTESEDRDGDIIRAAGWKLDSFKRHPVLVSSHDYMHLRSVIGEWVEMAVKGKQLEGVAHYYIGEGNEEADWGFKLASRGRAAYSVGFIPIEWKERGERGYEFISQELLEVSHVVVPSNRDALQMMARSIGLQPAVAEIVGELLAENQPATCAIPGCEAISQNLICAKHVAMFSEEFPHMKAGRVMSQVNLNKLHTVMDSIEAIHTGVCDMGEDCPHQKHLGEQVSKVVPPDVSRVIADEGESWSAPNLGDFTSEGWDDLSDAEKRRIAGHYAWAASMPPEKFGDLKLPHHRPSDGKVVWRGVAAAMGALMGARGGVDISDGDRRSVYRHLSLHYDQFDKEPPELRSVPEPQKPESRLTVARIFEDMEE